MPATAQQDNIEQHLRLITERLETGALEEIRNLANVLHPAEIASVLEALQPVDREIVWQLIDGAVRGPVLVELGEEVRNGIIEAIGTDDFIEASGTLETDDLADLLQEAPEQVRQEVLRSMDLQKRRRLEAVLRYDEDTAGGLMSLDTLTVSPDVTLDAVLRSLRLRGELPDLTDSLFVVDEGEHYLGILSLSALLTRDGRLTVGELMESDVAAIPAQLSAAEVAILFENRDLISAPVVDEQHRLIGRITVDDVVDVIREEADHSFMSRAGLGEDQDMFAPVILSAKRRAVWLGINLFTAFLASWVIGLFEATIERVVALAVLMPIVASMGGIAGSQTLTLVIRGLALRQIGVTNAHLLLARELTVGALNGILWALVVATIAGLWFQHAGLGVLIGSAMIINLICAALAGAVIPLVLQRFGIDPALAGGVVLTTVTDVVGFMAFLGLATLYLV